MLLKFTVKNYMSFKNEMTFDFTKHEIMAYPVSMILGNTATGKTSFVSALKFMTNCITCCNQNLSGNDGYLSPESPRTIPFVESNTGLYAHDGLSTFNVVFKMPSKLAESNPFDDGNADNRIYEYGFTVSKYSIIKEWLYYYTVGDDSYKLLKKNRSMVFVREYGKKTKFSNDMIDESHRTVLHRIRGNISRNESDRLKDGSFVLRDGALTRCDVLQYVYKFFAEMYIERFTDNDVYLDIIHKIPNYLDEHGDFIDKYEKLLCEICNDYNIKSVEIRTNVLGKKELYIIHTIGKDESNTRAFPIYFESDGIKKCAALVFYTLLSMNTGGVFVVDDIDKQIDECIVTNICYHFYAAFRNEFRAQLIGTTSTNCIAFDNVTDSIGGMEGKLCQTAKNSLGECIVVGSISQLVDHTT